MLFQPPVPTDKPGASLKDVIFTVAEKGLPQVETWEMFKIPQKESGTDEGFGTVWLVGWIPSFRTIT